MERRIVGFHQDDEGDWVAELNCLHTQHVRHRPPFFNRPWTESAQGREGMLGQPLNCPLCDRREFPEGLTEYKRTPEFTQSSVPAGLLRDHSTKEGVWGRICVLEGRLLYTVTLPQMASCELKAGDEGVVVPQMLHSVQPDGNVRFYVAFYKKAQ